MIHLTVRELLALQKLKLACESRMKLENSEPHDFTIDDFTALTKICEGFVDSKVKIRFRKPRGKK